MSQLENTQSVVLQQADGKKIYLDLNVSTDTTAIWSFWLAMIIALILGTSATIIAVWYGRKSFNLTKQSFDAVIRQIESSEIINLETNRLLINSQNELKIKEQKIIHNNNELLLIMDLVADIYSISYELINERILVNSKHISIQKVDSTQCCVLKLVSVISKFLVFIGFENSLDKELRDELLKFQQLAWYVYTELLESFQEKKELKEEKMSEFLKEFHYLQKRIDSFIILKKAA